MDHAALKVEDGETQWKYTVYLVGFPSDVGFGEKEKPIFNVSEMIHHLVPEARILHYSSFSGDVILQSRDTGTDIEDEDDVLGNENESDFKAVQDGLLSVPTDPLNLAVSDAEGDDTGPVAFDEGGIDFEDSQSVASTTPDHFSVASIENEALGLLKSIQSHAPTDKSMGRGKILLAGYGFGGIVVKQAVIIANTTPEYYDIALSIASLGFFVTPHRSENERGWEAILLDMIKASDSTHSQGRLSQVLARLVTSVSQLSHEFYRFASKYPVSNFIESNGISGYEPIIGHLGTLGNNCETVLSWSGKDFNSIMFCTVDQVDRLEELRTHFAPTHLCSQGISIRSERSLSSKVPSDVPADISKTFDAPSAPEQNDAYFEFLQLLSTSRWILYESRTMETYDDFMSLNEIYGSLLKGISSTRVRDKGSIQVIAPSGYGKSAILKIIGHEIRQKSPVVVIDNFLLSPDQTPSVYSVHVSFIHQIISQRPSMFYAVRNMIDQALRHHTWTEEMVRLLLESILHHGRAVELLIVIYDYDDWPKEVRSWWSETLRLQLKSSGMRFTFVISSRELIQDLSDSKPHQLNLKKKYERYKNNFVRVKLDSLLNRGYGSVRFGHNLAHGVRKKILNGAKAFEGSFTAIGTYLEYLVQSFPLTTLAAIEGSVEASPKTEKDLYDLQITALRLKHIDISYWLAAAISWMMWSARPLRIEELAAAAAVDMNIDYTSLEDVEETISMDMRRDLERHLSSIVLIEYRYGRIASAAARTILADANTKKDLGLLDHAQLTKICLRYLEHALIDGGPEGEADHSRPHYAEVDAKDMATKPLVTDPASDRVHQQGIGSKFQSHLSWKPLGLESRASALEFLDYACRFWPAHFLMVKKPDRSLKYAVVKFLRDGKIGERWFQLYLRSHAQVINPLSPEYNTQEFTTDTIRPDLSRPTGVVIDGVNTVEAAEPRDQSQHLPSPALSMACYMGLITIIPDLWGANHSGMNLEMVRVRRGGSERNMVFLETSSNYYMECAISNDNERVVRDLLESKETASRAMMFPLHEAALVGSLKTAKLLQSMNYNIVEKDHTGRTCLHSAAMGGSTEMIVFLLDKDSSELEMIDMQDNNQQTPLILAARMGHIKATKLLVDRGADVKARDNFGRTALHYAVVNCAAAVEYLAPSELGHILDNDGCTPLHITVRSGCVETTLMLVHALRISRRLDEVIGAEDIQDKTPLQYAGEGGYSKILDEILQHDKGVRAESSNYEKTAELAAARGHLGAVKALLSFEKHEDELMSKLLVAASRAGQLLVVQYLLKVKGTSADGLKSQSSRPLSEAASRGHIEVMRALLRHKASVNIEDARRKTPLHHAAENGMIKAAEELLDQKADVNAPDVERKTPLHSAASAGRVSVMKLLYKHKANIEASSRTRETPLHLAVKSAEAVEFLLSVNADHSATDTLGKTPLHMAARSRCPESARLLLDKGARADGQDDEGEPPLYYAISLDDLPMVQVLYDGQAVLSDSQEMEWAIHFGAIKVFTYLLGTMEKKPSQSDDYRKKLLRDAAGGKSAEILNLLLQSGADTGSDWCDKAALNQALHQAANARRVENMRQLLDHGCDIDARDEGEATALHTAARADSAEAVNLLLERGASIDSRDLRKRTPTFVASFAGNSQSLGELLKSDPDLKIGDDNNWTPLHAGVDNLEVARMLIDAGANPNHPKDDKWTPLHLATFWDQPPIVKLLLDHGGDPDMGTDDLQTALHLAVDEHSIEMVTDIINHDANVNCKDNSESTALHIALRCSRCCTDMAKLLIDRGADVTIKGRNNVSCLLMAVDGGNKETLDMVLNTRTNSPSVVTWELEDLTSAYWQALEHGRNVRDIPPRLSSYVAMANNLVKKEPRLVSLESNMGLTGVETCLSIRGREREEEPLAMYLLKLDTAAQPFARRRPDHPSAFELATISYRSIRNEFLTLCATYIPSGGAEVLEAVGIGFRTLRVAMELDDHGELWQRLEPMRQRVGGETDADGWSIDTFIHQSKRRFRAPVKARPEWVWKTPERMTFPAFWTSEATTPDSRFKIAEDGRDVFFADDPETAVCLRADFPFPPRPFAQGDQEIVYFEIKLLAPEAAAVSDADTETNTLKKHKLFVSIGFCGEFTDNTESHPGWRVWSAGYHGDDGCIYESSGTQPHSKGKTYRIGDTVGCGIDYEAEEYFFTLNGAVIARHQSKVIFRKLFPAIGHKLAAVRVKVSFEYSTFLWRGWRKDAGMGRSRIK